MMDELLFNHALVVRFRKLLLLLPDNNEVNAEVVGIIEMLQKRTRHLLKKEMGVVKNIE